VTFPNTVRHTHDVPSVARELVAHRIEHEGAKVSAIRGVFLVIGLLVGSVVVPASVHAAGGCGLGYVGTIGRVLAQHPTIVVARVIASRFDGAAFDLSVETVVTGAAHVGHWSFGPKLDPRPFQSCAPTGIPNGERDLIVIWRPGTNLNPYVSWPIAADESMPVLFVDQTATTLSGLLEELRSAVPATSTEPGTTDHRAPDSLVVFGLGIIAFAILVARPVGSAAEGRKSADPSSQP
jgi:hypothetical protein